MNKPKLIALLVILIAALFVAAYGLWAMGIIGAQAAAGELVQNVFVDINGDGQLDLLLTGEVIYNSPLSMGSQP